ncbi:MAG: hypothetical protein ACE5D0_09700 [Fidelibacterota bacterium]
MMRYLFLFMTITMCFSQEVKHIIVKLDGSTSVGLLDSMTTDTVFITTEMDSSQSTIPLKNVYYIYNTFGKLYYISTHYEDRIDLIEERSGFIVKINSDTLYYSSIEIDRRMDQPYIYLSSPDEELALKVSLFDIHLIRINTSYMEHSVRRGAITGTCLMLTGMALQTLFNYGDRRDKLPNNASLFQKAKTMGGAAGASIMNFIPGASSAGNQYQSVTIILPLSTIGWMIYDYIYDKRTHYFRPMLRDEQFPHSMFWFNPKRIIKNKVGKTIQKVRNVIQPLTEKWPF